MNGNWPGALEIIYIYALGFAAGALCIAMIKAVT